MWQQLYFRLLVLESLLLYFTTKKTTSCKLDKILFLSAICNPYAKYLLYVCPFPLSILKRLLCLTRFIYLIGQEKTWVISKKYLNNNSTVELIQCFWFLWFFVKVCKLHILPKIYSKFSKIINVSLNLS